MKDFTRPDESMALAVDAAIELEESSGCILAWQYLHMHSVPQGVSMRVLSHNGPRRAPGSDVQRVLLERRMADRSSAVDPEAEADRARCANDLKFHVPRMNSKLSETIDQAIEMMGVHNRFYAEALLRIHAVKTPVIMRVLFDVANRRAIAQQGPRPAPTRRMRLLHSV